MILTQGERMVWAAAFVFEREKISKQEVWAMTQDCLVANTDPQKIYDGVFRAAVRKANAAVEELREGAIKLRDDEEVDDSMLRAMLWEG